jgi:serine/threonine-protein kinase
LQSIKIDPKGTGKSSGARDIQTRDRGLSGSLTVRKRAMAADVFGIVGSVIAGAYHVERVVAEGGFGVVYRARHEGFRAPVALKLLKVPEQNPAQQAEFLELFRAEAELSFRLAASLPTVVRPLHVDAFTAADGRFVPYLVLEWLEGLTLDALIKQRNLAGLPAVPLRKLVRLLTPVARALERAHNFTGPEGAVCIVHCDLKPENLFLAQVAGEEVVKILDFGIGKVKSVASQAGRMSQNGPALMAFSPAYGAPEQWAPRHYGQTGPWTDVWGLALCIVEVLAARPIIEGDPATMMAITLDPKRRPTPRSEGVELPDGVEAVFARALALDPRARQRDAGVFWNELVASLQLLAIEQAGPPPRDPRSDAGAVPRVERVEVRSHASGSLPRALQPSAAVERALAMDLEFDPLGASQAARRTPLSSDARLSGGSARGPAPAAARSGAHVVPDLEFPAASLPRRPSSTQIAAQASSAQNVLDLDDGAGSSKPMTLDLDLPASDPILRRSLSSQRLRAVQPPAEHSGPAPQRSISGSISAVREATSGLASGTAAPARSSTPDLALSTSDGPRTGRGSVPPPRSTSREASPVPSALAPTSGTAKDAGSISKVENSPERTLAERLRLALLLVCAALLIAVLDPIYAAVTGEVLEILGLRLSLLAGILLLLALGAAVRELILEHQAE